MIESQNGRRVVITGVGVVAPCGIGVTEFWSGLTRLPEPSAQRRIADFDPAATGLSKVEVRRLDRFAQFAIEAAGQALRDAKLLDDEGLRGVEPERAGVFIGSGIGGAQSWESAVVTLSDKGVRAVSPLIVPMVMPNAAAGAVSMRFGLRGACETIATACATGTHSIGNAARLIAAGRADVVVAGGAEAALSGVALAGFGNMRALSPSGISRPFDVDRDGFCASEGAGIVVLEEAERAAARGAHVYAEVAGTGSTADAHHLTAPAPGGRGALACMRLALEDAGVAPGEVTHVNAHGTSTALNDASEAQAVAEFFAPHRPAVTSIKGVTGHSLGASGAIEAVALALSYAHRALPPTVGTVNVDPELDIDVVLEPRAWVPAPAISNSFGFGGHNGTLVFKPV
jgi:3-oxoacyl-[acyl-carrier-protein] synthase II